MLICIAVLTNKNIGESVNIQFKIKFLEIFFKIILKTISTSLKSILRHNNLQVEKLLHFMISDSNISFCHWTTHLFAVRRILVYCFFT